MSNPDPPPPDRLRKFPVLARQLRRLRERHLPAAIRIAKRGTAQSAVMAQGLARRLRANVFPLVLLVVKRLVAIAAALLRRFVEWSREKGLPMAAKTARSAGARAAAQARRLTTKLRDKIADRKGPAVGAEPSNPLVPGAPAPQSTLDDSAPATMRNDEPQPDVGEDSGLVADEAPVQEALPSSESHPASSPDEDFGPAVHMDEEHREEVTSSALEPAELAVPGSVASKTSLPPVPETPPGAPLSSPANPAPNRWHEKIAAQVILLPSLVRNSGLKRWIMPVALLVLAGLIGLTLLGKMKREVWTYYTDEQGTRAAVQEDKTRYVLWEDPQPNQFQEQPGPQEKSAGPINQPGGRLEAAFSPDGTMMVLVRWEAPGTNADMYLSQWDGRVWSRPEPIASINTDRHNERGPAFSHDGRYLFFSSDRPGGEGGYDLYVARWNGERWDGIESLGSAVNSGEDEAGPAPSADDTRLYFSSNRSGAKAEDIFVAKRIVEAEQPAQEALPPIPRFDGAEAVTHLNSRQHDVQAALTERGDHVFLASDRDRTRQSGYGVYFSRVVDGVSLPPERVDLYIDRGNVTDPAVRMEGFDLLFSANHQSDTADQDPEHDGYRLYRTTTREVIGYTDLSRWEQFKELLKNIAWWIFLALAALIALIYLLEKWQDITSLFHKCLAGSAVAHLLLLFAMMAWLIVKEIEKEQEPPPSVINVTLDALAEEELALESVPEETEITQPDLSLPAQKMQANFDVPDSQPQENANALPIDAAFQKEAMQVEVKPTNANPVETHEARPAEESSLLSELSATALPEPEPPVLEERELADAPVPAQPAEDQFRPNQSFPAAIEQSETSQVADRPIETPTEVAEIAPAESIADEPAPTPLTEVHPELAEQSPADAPDSTEPLQSDLLAELPEAAPLSPETPLLEEPGQGAPAAPADPSENLFHPGDSLPGVATAPAEGGTVGDSAAQSQAGAAEVAEGALAITPADSGPVAPVGASPGESALPEPAPDAGPSRELPQTALLDPGLPILDEGDRQGGAPADTAPDLFKPGGSQPVSTPAQGSAAADQASSAVQDSLAIESGGLVMDQANLSSPLRGLEAAGSEPLAGGGSLGPATLDPSLTASLLPGELEAPEDPGPMTDFLKKQRGRPSIDVIKQLGGSDGTEMAIRASIKWLAENQEADGHWNARKHGAKGEFDSGVTGLALLCFYGWGARHDQDGDYRDHVTRALDWLLAQQQPDGDLSGGGLMYCHAIASIALCEAYGISKDRNLREPAERAIAYTLAAQSKTKGGWRYHPGDDSDTSITGWQYMAIHSARLAGLDVPETSFALARRWLDRAGGGKFGGLYGYQAPARNSPAMVATGMFCRQLDLLPPADPKQIESAGLLKMHPMKSRNLDFYYIYYATLALYQHQGPTWEAWNERLKEIVPLNQNKTGSNTGSWEPSRGLAENGGRVASTTLATLSLEVYYRLLPMYGFRGEDAPELKVKGDPSDDDQ